MLVVADASPLNILIRLGYTPILAELFQHLLIPMEVAIELRAPGAPEIVRSFMVHPPSWLEIRVVGTFAQIGGLHKGEAAAIQLAEESKADLLLIDEAAGRKCAVQRGLRVVGALGVLELAGAIGLIDFREAVHRLRRSDFHISDELVGEALNRHEGIRRRKA
jgi:predicted nucleic acid-binding protein